MNFRNLRAWLLQAEWFISVLGVRAVKVFTTSSTRSFVDELYEQKRLPRPTPNDTVMTTWHDDEELEEALDFFAMLAKPTDGYLAGSDYRLVICVGHPEWAETAQHFLQAAPLADSD